MDKPPSNSKQFLEEEQKSTKKVKTESTFPEKAITPPASDDEKSKRSAIVSKSKIGITEDKKAQENDIMDPERIPTEELTDSDSDISYCSDNDEEEPSNGVVLAKSLREMPNVMFYLNMVQSRPKGDYISNIHSKWKGDYKKLEVHHGYVQWLFPNHYASVFNHDSFKLTKQEAKIMRENKEIAQNIVKSYEMILDFFGMKITNRRTGELDRSKDYLTRYHETLITSLHNHMRVRRILAHLNIVGFRKYAIQFVNFLEKEIFSFKGGYTRYLAENPLKQETFNIMRKAPLYKIAKYKSFGEWRVYGETNSDFDTRELHKNCFTDDPKDYHDSILLR